MAGRQRVHGTVDVYLDENEARRLDALFKRFADRGSDVRPVLNDIADELWARNRAAFASAGAAIGERWAPNDARYAAFKAQKFGSSQVGVKSGALLRSLTRKAKWSVRRVGRRSLTVGSTNPAAHLFAGGHRERGSGDNGSRRSGRGRAPNSGGRAQPARPVVRVDSVLRRQWVNRIENYVVGDSERSSSSRVPGL